MIYVSERPIERKKTISVYSIPGFQKIRHFSKGKAGMVVKEAFVSIDIKRGQISFYTKAIALLGYSIGDKISFTHIDEFVYMHKSSDGNKIQNKLDGGMRVTHRTFAKYLISRFGISKTIKCQLKPTKVEFGGEKLFELVLPKYYASLYHKIKV